MKRKRIKKVARDSDGSSSDDPEERQRGAVNPLFGNAVAKKPKKNESAKANSQVANRRIFPVKFK